MIKRTEAYQGDYRTKSSFQMILKDCAKAWEPIGYVGALVDSTENSIVRDVILTTKQIRNVDNGFRAFYIQ